MKMLSIVVTTAMLVAMLLCHSPQTANALSPSVGYARVHFYELIAPNITAQIAVFTFGFNNQIKLKGVAPTPVFVGDTTYLTGLTITKSTVDGSVTKYIPKLNIATGVATLKCLKNDDTPISFSPATEAQLLLNDDPLGLMMLHPTADPAVSTTSLLGGITYPPEILEWQKDQLSFVIAMNGTRYTSAGTWVPFTNQGLNNYMLTGKAGQCWFEFGASGNTKTVVDATSGDALPAGQYWFNQTDMRISRQCVERLRKARVFHETFKLNATTIDQMIQWGHSIHSFNLFECYVGGPALADSLYTLNDASYIYNQTLDCVSLEGTPEWYADPCCNDQLAFSSHCNVRKRNVTTKVIGSYNLPSGISNDKKKLYTLALNAYQNAKQFVEFDTLHDKADDRSTAINFPSYFNELIGINTALTNCVNQVADDKTRIGTDCHQDQDCGTKAICDTSFGKCKIPQTEQHRLFAACVVSLNDEIRQMLYVNKNITVDDTAVLQNTIQALQNAIESLTPITLQAIPGTITSALHLFPAFKNLTQPDCVGPHSATCRSNFTITQDPWGNLAVNEIPANKTCCETVGKHCNWNARAVTTQSACVTDPTTDHFCGVADGSGTSDYSEIGHPAGCIATQYNTSTLCTNAGFTWYTQPDGYAACFMSGLETQDLCLGSSGSIPPCSGLVTTLNALSVGSYRSDDASVNDDASCGTTQCYAVLGETACNNLRTTTTNSWSGTNPMIKIKQGISYNPVLALCQASIHHMPLAQQVASVCSDMNGNLTLSAGTFKYHRGRAHRKGQWDTQASCELYGKCRIPYLNQYGISETVCRSEALCPHSCSRCVSPRLGRTGQTEKSLCYDSTALAENTCRTPGVWRNYTTGPTLLGGSNQNHGVCEYPVEYRAGCTSLNGGTFVTCGDLSTQATCHAAGPNSLTYAATSTSWMYKALQCQWDTMQACRTAAECSTEARCDDDELGGLCTCTPGLLCSCTGGSCINVWHLDPVTGAKNKCLLGNSNLRTTSVGCQDLSVPDAATCAGLGGSWTWYTKAYTKADCEAHGSACYALNSGDQNPGDLIIGRNTSECRLGVSGNTTFHYRWRVGSTDSLSDLQIDLADVKSNFPRLPQSLLSEVHEQVRWQPAQWVPRAWVPSGIFTDTLGVSALQQFAAQIAGQIAGNKQQMKTSQHFGRVVPVLSLLATAAATEDSGDTCPDCQSIIVAHHPLFINTPKAIHHAVHEQTVIIAGPSITNDGTCVPGFIDGVFFPDGSRVPKLCAAAHYTSTCSTNQETHITECTELVDTDLGVCTCTKETSDLPVNTPCPVLKDGSLGDCLYTYMPIASRCECHADDGTRVNRGVAQEMNKPTLFAKHRVMSVSTIEASVAAANPVVAAMGGNECLTDDQLNIKCATFTVEKDGIGACDALRVKNNACKAQQTTSHTAFGTQILFNVGTSLGLIPLGHYVLSSLTFNDVAEFKYYDIIHGTAPDGFIVGQLIGNCILHSADDNPQFPQKLQATIDPSIARNTDKYTVLGFCKSDYAFGPPWGLPVALNGNYLAAQIEVPGVYCPCIHTTDWKVEPITRISEGTARLVVGLIVGLVGGLAVVMGLVTAGQRLASFQYSALPTAKAS